jgi:hypothetical protein
MKAIVIKELKENAKWAALLLLGLAILLGWAAQTVQSQSTYGGGSFVSYVLLNSTLAGFSAAGLILGLLQTLQDHWRGRYAFVMHRPIAASSMFWGKVIAGLSIYLVITAVPLLAVIAWVRSPGIVAAPFDWHMALPSFWDLINGSTWYFAGMLIGSRPGRWLGSRIMPLAMPLFCTWLGFIFTLNIGEALITTAVALLILLPAAWGGFIHAGNFERQSRVVRSLQTVCVTLGLGLAVAMGTTIIFETLRVLIPAPREHYSYWNYRVDQDGQVKRFESNDGRETQVTDPSGKPLEPLPRQYEGKEAVAYVSLLERQSAMDRRGGESGFHSPAHYLWETYQDSPRTIWYYVCDRRTIEGYETTNRLRIGSINPGGFAPASEPPKPFPMPLKFAETGNWIQFAYDRIHLYQLDLGSRQEVKLLMTTTADDPIVGVGRFREGSDVVVVTGRTLRVLRGDQELVRSPLQWDAKEIRWAEIGRLEDGSLNILFMLDRPNALTSYYHFTHISAAGQIEQQSELPPLPVMHPQLPTFFQWWEEFLQEVIAPPLLVLVVSIIVRAMGKPVAPNELLHMTLLFGMVALVCGAIAFWLTRRYAFSRASRIVWTCFGALIGLPGLLGLLAMRNWPARAKCLSCNKPRVVTRESCEHCNALFAPPSMQGTEIFE